MKLSIITICKNAQEIIEQTILSVINQTYKNIEYIIIDGSSEDKSFDIIQKYKNQISLIISEKDTGIYNAMNKAIKIATGDVLYFLNAEDHFVHTHVVALCMNRIEKTKADLLYGMVVAMNKDNGKFSIKKLNNVSKSFFYSYTLPHQGVFFKRDLFLKFGYFNEKFSICADYELILRMFVDKDIVKEYINTLITVWYIGGHSSNKQKFTEERKKIKNKYFNKMEHLIFSLSNRFKYKIYN